MPPKTPKKGSPSKKKVDEPAPAPEPKKKAATSSSDQKRKTRHQYDRVTHQVFTPFFNGLETHLVKSLEGKASSEDIHNALISYDAKSYFSSAFETKGRRATKRNKTGEKRPLSTFMLFQDEMRPRVTQKLEKELGRKPSQPEVVTQLGKLWKSLKEREGGIDKYKKLYEENKKKAEASKVKDDFDSDNE